jgi:opacity protein-like surface antigen
MKLSNSTCELPKGFGMRKSAGRGIRLASRGAMLMAGCIAAVSVGAAESPRHVNTFEITPFIGYMGGGKFEDPADNSDRDLKEDTVFGLFADMMADGPERHYELLYANQSSTVKGATKLDMDVQYLHIGGTVSYPDTAYVVPFFGATVGATRFSPDVTGLDNATKLSFSLGGGIKIPITDHVGLRFDARAFITLLDNNSKIFCVSAPPDAACRISARSDTFVQYAAGLGIIAAF